MKNTNEKKPTQSFQGQAAGSERTQQNQNQNRGVQQTGYQQGATRANPSEQQKQGQQARHQGAPVRTVQEPVRQLEKENRSKTEAPSNEDWEGGGSRPVQETQAPAVKKNVAPPEIPNRETPDPRQTPTQGGAAKQGNTNTENK